MSNNLPFSVGDRVKFGPEFRDFRGDNRESFDEEKRARGSTPSGTGVVTGIHDDCNNYVADVEIINKEGERDVVEAPFVSLITTTPKRSSVPKASSMTPQVRRIRRHLLKGNTITQRSALMDFGIMALPRRIADLKETGFPIETTMERNSATGQRFAMYRFKTVITDPKGLIPGCTYRMVDVVDHMFASDLVEASEGHLTIATAGSDGFTCRIKGIHQFALGWGSREIFLRFSLEYVGGLS